MFRQLVDLFLQLTLMKRIDKPVDLQLASKKLVWINRSKRKDMLAKCHQES